MKAGSTAWNWSRVALSKGACGVVAFKELTNEEREKRLRFAGVVCLNTSAPIFGCSR